MMQYYAPAELVEMPLAVVSICSGAIKVVVDTCDRVENGKLIFTLAGVDVCVLSLVYVQWMAYNPETRALDVEMAV